LRALCAAGIENPYKSLSYQYLLKNMNFSSYRYRTWIWISAVALPSLLLLLSIRFFPSFWYRVLPSNQYYLIFHSIVEIVSIILSLQIFILSWLTYKHVQNFRSLFISVSFLGVAILDTVHVFSFPGMPGLFTAASTHKAIFFWLGARLGAVGALLAASFIPQQKDHRLLSFPFLSGVVLALVALVVGFDVFLGQYVPPFYVEGEGLTSLKIVLEYVIIALGLAAFFSYHRQYLKKQDSSLPYLMAAIILTIISEFCFTLYGSAVDIYNFMGHIYKFISYGFLFYALFVAEIKQPYLHLGGAYRRIEESEQHRREISALLAASQAVLAYREFQDAARIIFDYCKVLVGARAGYAALTNKDETEYDLLFLDTGGLACSVDPGLPLPIRGLREVAHRTGKAVYENDFPQSKWMQFIPKGHVSLDNVLFAPLLIEGKVAGLLGLANKPGGFTENDLRLASTFGELAAIALFNSRILESLKISEERHRSMIQSTSDAIISADGSSRIISWNRGAQNIFGYDPEEILGKPLTLLMTEKYRDTHYRMMDRTLAAGKTSLTAKTVELQGLRKNGGEFPLELSLSSWREGEVLFFTGIVRDITERKRAEEEIQSLAKFPLENPHPIMRIAHDGALLYTNKAGESLFTLGGGPEGPRVSENIQRLVQEVVHTQKSKELELKYQDKIFSLIFTYIADADYVNVYGLDITERKRTEQELNEYHHRLEAMVEKRTEELREANEQLLRDIAERKRAEEALGKAQQNWQGTFEAVSDGVWLLDTEGRIIQSNGKFEHLIGKKTEELIGEHCFKHAHGTADFIENCPLQRMRQTRKREREEIEDRERGLWLEVTVDPIFDESGTMITAVHTVRDITERKRAEEALRDSERHLSLAASIARVGHWDWNPSAGKLIWTDEVYRIFGYEPGEIVPGNETFTNLLHPEDRNRVNKVIFESLRRLIPYDAEFRFIRKDGGERFGRVSGSGEFDAEGGMVRLSGAVQDITSIRQAEKALQESEERFRLLAENAQDIVYRYRLWPTPQFDYISPAVTAMIGYTPEEFYADSHLAAKVVYPEDKPFFKSFWRSPHTLATPSVFRWLHKDGTVVWMEHLNTVIYDDEGKIIAVEGIARDCTERKKMEEEILKYQEQLRSLASELALTEERQRRRMAVDLHDHIGQALTVAKMKLEAMRRKTTSPALVNSLREIETLTEQTIQDTRSLIFDLSPPVLYELGFKAAVEWLGEQIQQKHGILIIIEDDRQPIPIDENTQVVLFQAVRELLFNIVKHAQVRNAQISFKKHGDNIQIKVIDKGVGFNPQEVYSRVNKTGGFGLFSIRERLHHLGCKMEVKSEPGHGTEVTLFAPLKFN
jgi:PAS domain S-box-containing protein